LPSTLSLAMSPTVEAWPETGHAEWVRNFVLRELPELQEVDVSVISSGFMSSSFKVVAKGGQAYCFCRSFYPKHRAWAYYNSAAALGLAPEVVLQRYDPAYMSVEMTKLVDGRELMSYDTYVGLGDGVTPGVELVAKCGRLLAKLHKMGTGWHTDFADEAAADKARIPRAPDGILNDVFDTPEGILPAFLRRLFQYFADEDAAETGCDKAFLSREAARILDHPVLPTSGPLARLVSAHGDFHGANILVQGGEPLAIDFESCFVGPAGWDVAHLYQYLRRLAPEHDYSLTVTYARAYLEELGEDVPIDIFILDMLAWYYFVCIKQGPCVSIVKRLGTEILPASGSYAARVTQRDYMESFCETIAAAREDPELRARIVKSGKVAD
jgi:tRNA A-37 threonylcarbamoyl transferase component Bud32